VIWERATGKPIHNAIVWQDRRSAPLCEALRQSGHETEIAAQTGLLLDPYFSASKIAWLLDNVSGARAAALAGKLAFGTIDAFLLWRLTGGQVHATDATNAARTALFDIGKGANGFAFSPALSSKGGKWNWDLLSQWLTSPKAFAPGTKMTFAGISNPQDRANVIAFLNQHSDGPQPLPAAPAAATADTGGKASDNPPGAGPGNGAQPAGKEPVLTEQQAGTNSKNVNGEGAPKVDAPASVKKQQH